MHFTHIEHLETVINNGLLCDTDAQSTGVLTREAGNVGIKAARRKRPVPIEPYGRVADYVPFYFAARSPMMSAISNGKVPEFGTDSTSLMYLATTTQILVEGGLKLLFTDRNARLDYAKFKPEADGDDLVDWNLMKQRYWANTDQDPERKERRMAECLVHQRVPFDRFGAIMVHREEQAEAVRSTLAANGQSTEVYVRPDWYI
ncbi:DUF4433 domain-containing protein [Mycolicibacterium novocastrense]|uniref:DUF4433 domain-containing protein n=1 Tax=Mycolicibacterium novocastrense TaxID=59813 RepID=A0AAW5SWL5_MYCNV|nr:DUF4433 domain-containing protein [Mycolicibacterium novocastrense]MCV7027504.1 DUF4433 domain-containing protein [Mycolicibacterium novocastrense]GAT07396.1 uncharacterized protein RMCN_0529 [Mycolicibacterium novocastrense]